MKLTPPDGVKSINVAGVEYSPDGDGRVDISDPRHIAAAQSQGFTEYDDIPVVADQLHPTTEE